MGKVSTNVSAGALAVALAALAGAALADDSVQARVVEVRADTVKLGRGTEAGVREKQIFDIYGDTPDAYALPLTGGATKIRVKQVLLARAIVVSADRTSATARVFDEKKKVETGAFAVLNREASAPDQPPRVRGFSPLPKTTQATTAWRGKVPLKVDVDVDPGRRVYYEWNTDGGTIVHGVEVAPGVFRTTLPENAWTAPFDQRAGGYGVTVRITDNSQKSVLQNFRLMSAGAGDAHPDAVRWKRTFTAKGTLSSVRDIAFDRANRAFVLDVKSGIVSDDVFVRELDQDGNEIASAKADSKKYTSLAVSDSFLFFLDLRDNTVKRWQRTGDVSGVFAAQPVTIGEKGTGNGKLDSPVDLALAPDGAILVLDQAQRCVMRYDADGRFAYSFGKPGEGEHELKKPTALCIGEDGAVHVLDDGRKKIVTYRNGRAESADVDAGVPGEELVGIAVDPWTGGFHVLEKSNGAIKHFDRRGDPLAKTAAQGWNDLASLAKPSRLRMDGTRLLYAVDRDGASLARFDAASESKGFPFLARMGGVKMSRDVRLGVSTEGNVVVLDKDAPAVLRFDQSGWASARFGGEASGAGQLKKPAGVAVDEEGNIFVADAKRIELLRYQPNGNLQWAKGGERVFQEIRDCQITGRRERVAVLQDRDEHARFIALATQAGEVDAAVPASPTDEISRPICATLTGRLEPGGAKEDEVSCWIVDKSGERLSRFKLGSNAPIAIERKFDKITGIAAGIANVLFVCDKGSKVVDVFSGSGAFLSEIKDPEHCEEPIDVGTDDFGRLYVFDKSNDGRIVVFGGD